MERRWRLIERHLVTDEGVTVFFVLQLDGSEWEFSVEEAQGLAADLVLAVDRVDPARWGHE